MSGQFSHYKTSNSIEEKIQIKQRYLERLMRKFALTGMLFWATLSWLSLYKIHINLLIVGTPILSFYLYLFYRYYKKYRRLKCELEELEALLQKEDNYYYSHPQKEIMYFRRD